MNILKKTLADPQRSARIIWIVAICLIVLSLGTHFMILREAFLGLPPDQTSYLNAAEEHFNIGYNLYKTGLMTNQGHFNTERPPAYPIYVAGALHCRDFILSILPDDSSGAMTADEGLVGMLQNDQIAVALANLPLAFISALLLFKLLKEQVAAPIALAVLVLYLTNIHFLAIINKYDYSMMEGMIILIIAIQFYGWLKQPRRIRLVFLGITLGLACLVRPVYLLFPAFFGAYDLFFGERKFKPAFLRAILIAGIAFVIMIPNVIRNYNVAHKFILVSEQGGVEVYHNAVVSLWSHPEYANYGDVWRDYGWPLMKESLGLSEYNPSIWYTDTARVADAYLAGSKKVLLSQPQVLISNIFFNIKQIAEYDLDYWGGKYFKHNEKHAEGFNAYKLYRSFFVISGSIVFLAVLLLPGKKELFKTLLFITALLVLSYSLVYYYPRYNYIKIPIYFISTAITLNWVWNLKKYQWITRPAVIMAILAAFYISIMPLYYFYIYL